MQRGEGVTLLKLGTRDVGRCKTTIYGTRDVRRCKTTKYGTRDVGTCKTADYGTLDVRRCKATKYGTRDVGRCKSTKYGTFDVEKCIFKLRTQFVEHGLKLGSHGMVRCSQAWVLGENRHVIRFKHKPHTLTEVTVALCQ